MAMKEAEEENEKKTAIRVQNGLRIRAAREMLGLTPEEMAPLLGYRARSRIYEIESGTRTPGPAVELLLRAYLDGYRPANWPSRLRANGDGQDRSSIKKRLIQKYRQN
ncbi:helix-turn-helix domain-containing protein [Hyphomicrobium sp.]|uniref:helix-turn-helix domain-containing protein n=1 Tax=Hyphomicrobium sp. TaxID=82 RepID=UPI002FE4249E